MKKLFLLAFAVIINVHVFSQVPAILPEVPIFNMPLTFPNVQDIVVNCDMLETNLPTNNENGSVLKAIVWDNGMRSPWAPGTRESWLYVEDPMGNNVTLSLNTALGTNTIAPDVVIANDVDPGPNGLPDFIVAITYMEEFNQEYGYVHLRTYDVFNAGTPLLNVVFREDLWVGSDVSRIDWSPGDGNPHIDMWTNSNMPIHGFPSLRNAALSWSLDNLWNFSPTTGWVQTNPQILHYSYVDVSNLMSMVYAGAYDSCLWNSDIACYHDISKGEDHLVIAYNNSAGTLLQVADVNINTNTAFNTSLIANQSLITRIEAMSQYDPGQYVNWEVAALFQTGNVWQAYGINNFNGGINFDHLSVNYQSDDNKCPAVAAGVDPFMNSNVGNMQYTLGYKPMDYNWPCTKNFDIFSRELDAFSATLGSLDYQVNSNSTPICYPWDVNKAYAVSNCSNSGLCILSSWHNGNDIVYKLSPNIVPMVYRPSSISDIDKQRPIIFPNPATTVLNIKGMNEIFYEIVDATGKVLLSGNVADNKISVGQLQSGLYILKAGNNALKFYKL